jgi:hypothetical protein
VPPVVAAGDVVPPAAEPDAVAGRAVAAAEEDASPPAGAEVDAVAHPARPAATAATRRSRDRMPLRRRTCRPGWASQVSQPVCGGRVALAGTGDRRGPLLSC